MTSDATCDPGLGPGSEKPNAVQDITTTNSEMIMDCRSDNSIVSMLNVPILAIVNVVLEEMP